MQILKGYGMPTTSTTGNVSDRYIDLETGAIYECIAVKSAERDFGYLEISNYEMATATYVWSAISSVGGVTPDLSVNDPSDPAYVKNRTHWVEEVITNSIIPETTFNNINDGVFTIPDILMTSLKYDVAYTVVWNGVKYNCYLGKDVQEEENGPFVGKQFGGTSGEPFSILVYMINIADETGVGAKITCLDGVTSVTMSIYQGTEIVHPIPEKFLPESFGESTVTLYGEQDTSFSMGDEVMAGYLCNDADCQNVMTTADIVAIADKNIIVWFAADDGSTYIVKPNIIAVDMGVCASGMVNGGGIMLFASDYNMD